MRQQTIRLLLGVALLLPSWAADNPRFGGELRLAIQAEPKTSSPLLAADEPSLLVRYLTTGVLIRLNRVTQNPEPELAASWKIGDGGKRISFQLRRGLTFSDGTLFDARDVCYTIGRILEPTVRSPMADAFRSERGAVACETGSADSVTLRSPEPWVGFEQVLDGTPILSSRSAQKDTAGLGPFVVAEQKAGAYLVLTRNPRYWKRDATGHQLPYLDSMRLEVQRNRDFELFRFRSGDFGIINNLDPDSFEKLKANMPDAVRDLGISLDTEQLWFNQAPSAPVAPYKMSWFQSREFRLAVSQAINRADIARVVYKGLAAPATGPVSSANRFWYNAALRPLITDPKAALARLTQAGFHLRDRVLQDASGHPVEFSIITNSGNKSRERMAAMIQQDLGAIGIRVSVVPLDFRSLIDRIAQNFDYEACLLGLVASDLDPSGQMNVWLSSGAQHQWNPNQKKPATDWEAEIDRLMRAQSSTLDANKRKTAFDRVQQIVVDQAPFIYLVHRRAAVAVAPSVRNVEASILRPQALWNAERIYLDERAQNAAR
jgi:peptide/nickel transport system substrate-binding protein